MRRTVQAGRLSGRGIRILVEVTPEELPPALSGETWIRTTNGNVTGWLLTLPRPPARKLAVKRWIDLVLGSTVLLLLMPFMALIAVGVRLSSRGPILYRWRVVGQYGRRFTGYKFRTMVADADRLKPDLLHRNEMEGPVFKIHNDPRVTSFGRLLRRYSLDELPQLWSVIRGHMSLVGPRPALTEEYERYELWQMRRLTVRPGMTGLWQVQGRNTIRSFGDWARLDLGYIDQWTLRLDARILAKTMLAVIRGTGR